MLMPAYNDGGSDNTDARSNGSTLRVAFGQAELTMSGLLNRCAMFKTLRTKAGNLVGGEHAYGQPSGVGTVNTQHPG
jgi:hypothetical protein